MNTDFKHSLRLSFAGGEDQHPVPPVLELLARVRSSEPWDEASIFPADGQFPRVHINWLEGQGFVVQCFEDDHSWGYFLVSAAVVSPPAIEIVLGGQAMERWPPELFVSEELVSAALDFFVSSGKQKPGLRWVRADGFPRQVVWEGRQGREAWERTNPVNNRDA